MPAVEKIRPPRLVLSIEEAAASIGMGLTKFREDVLPQLRVIRMGTWRGIAVSELQEWADREGSLGGH